MARGTGFAVSGWLPVSAAAVVPEVRVLRQMTQAKRDVLAEALAAFATSAGSQPPARRSSRDLVADVLNRRSGSSAPSHAASRRFAFHNPRYRHPMRRRQNPRAATRMALPMVRAVDGLSARVVWRGADVEYPCSHDQEVGTCRIRSMSWSSALARTA